METVNDYVNIEENQPKEESTKVEKPKPKRKPRARKRKEEPEIDPDVQIEMLDGLEKYVGENISAVDIRKKKDSEIESLFKVYEEKSGQELMKDGMGVAVEGIVKGLSYFLF